MTLLSVLFQLCLVSWSPPTAVPITCSRSEPDLTCLALLWCSVSICIMDFLFWADHSTDCFLPCSYVYSRGFLPNLTTPTFLKCRISVQMSDIRLLFNDNTIERPSVKWPLSADWELSCLCRRKGHFLTKAAVWADEKQMCAAAPKYLSQKRFAFSCVRPTRVRCCWWRTYSSSRVHSDFRTVHFSCEWLSN